jgi:hypothetical protein
MVGVSANGFQYDSEERLPVRSTFSSVQIRKEFGGDVAQGYQLGASEKVSRIARKILGHV